MLYNIEAACLCSKGKIRENNEDNFLLDGKCLEQKNDGLRNPVGVEQPLKSGFCTAVFDGMGGEDYGEVASYTAAMKMKESSKRIENFFVSEKKYLHDLCLQLNRAVVDAAVSLGTSRMGTTIAALYFSGRYVYACNIGDSRIYRLRNSEFMQLSVDHVEQRPNGGKKQPLTQHLGIPADWFQIEPYIAKGEFGVGDRFLICSDGLTDMLSNIEICDIMLQTSASDRCVEALVDAALNKGGRDNVTVVICAIS